MAEIIRFFGEDIAKPVVAGTIVDARAFHHVGEGLYGTAFPIGGSRFITAQHVTNAIAATGGQIHLGWPHAGQRLIYGASVPMAPANLLQEWPEVDLAAIESPGVDYRAGVWAAGEVPNVLYPVSATGYPFGFDISTHSLTLRAFSGTIVSSRSFDLGRRGNRTFVYELSFAAPRGLSGAALLADGVIVGCVVGNQSAGMMVYAGEERLDEAGAVTRVERFEALHLGIAIRTDVILALKFPDGQTVREWVGAHNGTIRG
jgi:hypothetical protein